MELQWWPQLLTYSELNVWSNQVSLYKADINEKEKWGVRRGKTLGGVLNHCNLHKVPSRDVASVEAERKKRLSSKYCMISLACEI